MFSNIPIAALNSFCFCVSSAIVSPTWFNGPINFCGSIALKKGICPLSKFLFFPPPKSKPLESFF